MKTMSGLKLLFVAVMSIIILAGTSAAVGLSNSGGGTWKYQRDISIKENSGTTLTDYQVMVELRGADFPVEAQSSGADIRFTDSDSEELNYWIESWDYPGKSAKAWMKVPRIPKGATTAIHMYYGNPSATSQSSITATFIDGDDFKTDTSSNYQWARGSGSFYVSNGVMHIGGGGSTAKTLVPKVQNPPASYIIEMYAQEDAKHLLGVTGFMDSLSGQKQGYSYYINVNSGDNFILSRVDAGILPFVPISFSANTWYYFLGRFSPSDISGKWNRAIDGTSTTDSTRISGYYGITTHLANAQIDWWFVRCYASREPTITLLPPKSSNLSITKSVSPISLRQFQESTIKVLIENAGTSEVKAIEIMDSIHPSFDLIGGDFPNPKKFDSIRPGESRELQYTIKSKESGSFTLDPATVTYADIEGNIQEAKSEPVSIKVIPSSDGGSSGTNTGQNSKSASVSLHGEKTDVVMGEDILLRLSAVNLITKPKMHVQVIIIPPSGMSVTSSEFSKSAAGQFTANYQLEPGDGKDIEVRIRSNQVGDFNVNGRIIYYFGDDKDNSEDQTLNLPMKVRKEIASTPTGSERDRTAASVPGFEAVFTISMLALVVVSIRRM